MSKSRWRVYLNYGSGYGWVPVNWAPIFDTKQEAWDWAMQDHDWDAPVDVMQEGDDYDDAE